MSRFRHGHLSGLDRGETVLSIWFTGTGEYVGPGTPYTYGQTDMNVPIWVNWVDACDWDGKAAGTIVVRAGSGPGVDDFFESDETAWTINSGFDSEALKTLAPDPPNVGPADAPAIAQDSGWFWVGECPATDGVDIIDVDVSARVSLAANVPWYISAAERVQIAGEALPTPPVGDPNSWSWWTYFVLAISAETRADIPEGFFLGVDIDNEWTLAAAQTYRTNWFGESTDHTVTDGACRSGAPGDLLITAGPKAGLLRAATIGGDPSLRRIQAAGFCSDLLVSSWRCAGQKYWAERDPAWGF